MALLAAAVIAAAAWVWRSQASRHDNPARSTSDPPTTNRPSGATATPSDATTAHRVRRLSPDDRRRLAEQIAAARARHRAASAGTTNPPGAPALEDPTITLEQVSSTVKAALEAAIPLLAECYPADAARPTAAVQMIMTSDPDVGTVIDTTELRDEHGQPLPRALDDCLRTTIESLGLPPLEQGGKLPLQYSFRFD